ncbi:MAG: DUF4386 domain-containing protein [Candidatus Acidiferrales bacterium]|jgi:hypothetical protein
MPGHAAETSPRLKARIAGVFYLITIVTGIFGEVFVRGRLIVYGDAAATATNILAHQTLLRLGFALDLIPVYIVVTVLFYDLFKPVNRSLSLLAAFFSLAGCAIGALNSLFQLAPLLVLRGEQYLSIFNAGQQQALALMFLELRAQGFDICLVFFGFYCILIGYLIFRSTFLPKILGVLMAIAGLGYLINSFATFLSPAFAIHLIPYVLAPGLLGEGSLTVWLLAVGVNVQRWKEQESAA